MVLRRWSAISWFAVGVGIGRLVRVKVASPGRAPAGFKVLRAVAKAWSWRRKRNAGSASTNLDLAHAEDVSDGSIGRMIMLAYLAPAVLKKLLLLRPFAMSLKGLTAIADLPWAEQVAAAFGPSEA
jgi:hypothetical protein